MSDPSKTLVCLLEKEFSRWRSGTPLAEQVPQRLWEQALLEPLRDFLGRPGKQLRAHLAQLSWKISGGQGEAPVELALLVEIFHAGSLIVDDIQDESSHRRGAFALHRIYGLPLALNAANWLYFLPFSLVEQLGLPEEGARTLRHAISRTLLNCHYGQALDLGARVFELSQDELPGTAAALTTLKTGSLMRLSSMSGALAAGAKGEVVVALARFGESLGCGLQMLNDFEDVKGKQDPTKRLEDLRNGRVTWPWAWLAQSLDEASFSFLQEEASQVASGAKCPTDLAQKMQEASGGQWANLIHAQLQSALSLLREQVGESAALEELRRKVVQLEGGYA